jgi:hypothetical protein
LNLIANIADMGPNDLQICPGRHSCQGSEAYAHQPTVAVAAPTSAATGVEKPAPRLMATIPAATSNVSNDEATSGRCGNILQSFLNAP